MLTYYHLWKMNPREARRILVKDYEETKSYSQTARNFATHRRIVRKWVLRHQEAGEAGLESLPPIPKSQPTRLDPQLERLILRLREASGFGPKRLHYWLRRNLKIEITISTIAKYLHKHKRTKKHLKRGAAAVADSVLTRRLHDLRAGSRKSGHARGFSSPNCHLMKNR